MSVDTRKIALGFAATAVTAAACLSPIAHADFRVPLAPTDSGSSSADNPDNNENNSVGSSAGKARNNRGAVNRANDSNNNNSSATPSTSTPDTNTPNPEEALPETPKADSSANATGSNPLIQNKLWWFGTPNPNPPPSAVITQTEPLANLPGWMRPSFGWFTDNNIETCVLGMGHTTVGTVGPYGTATTSISTRGC